MWTRISYFSRETLVSLRRNVLMTIAGIATVAVSLALFGGILMLSKWVDHGTEQHQGRRDARDLHEGQRDRPADQAACRTRSTPPRAHAATSSRTGTSPRPTRTPSSSASSGATPTSSTASAPQDLPESFRVVPKKAELTETREGCNSARQQGVDSVTTPGEALKGLIDVTNTVKYIFYRHLVGAAGVVAVPHRQHDPPRHVRPPPRDRGDEARGRVELVRAHPVHRRGHGAGPGGRRDRRSSRSGR